MIATQITEKQFIDLAISAVKDNSIKSTSMTILNSNEGILIQSTSGEYLLISE